MGIPLALLMLFAMALPPLVIWAGRLARSEVESERAVGAGCGGCLLWLGFSVSMGAIWGATTMRKLPDIVPWWVGALVLLQPVALAAARWAVKDAEVQRTRPRRKAARRPESF